MASKPPQHSPMLYLRELLRWTVVIVGGAVVSVLLALAHIALGPAVFIAALLVSTYFVWNDEHGKRLEAEEKLGRPAIRAHLIKSTAVDQPNDRALGIVRTWVLLKVFVANDGAPTRVHEPCVWGVVCGKETRAPLNDLQGIFQFMTDFDGTPMLTDVKPEELFQRKVMGIDLRDGVGHEGTIVTFFPALGADVDLASLHLKFKDSAGGEHRADYTS